jgi:multiple sugar transport system permease protein
MGEMSRGRRRQRLRHGLSGYLFIAPALLLLIWWGLVPIGYAAFLSVHEWNLLAAAKPFVGLRNYISLLGDTAFWSSALNTLYYSLQIPIGMGLALLAAVALEKRRGSKIIRTIYFMPGIVAMVVSAIVWRWLYTPQFGLLNYLLHFLRLGPYDWLASPDMAMPSVMIMMIWYTFGYRVMMFATGLAAIPTEYYEAAQVDGARGAQLFFRITLPLLRPVLFFVFVTSVVASFQVFVPIWVMTGGGPAGSTEVMVYRIYLEAWNHLNMGYASAQSLVLFAMLLLFTWFQLRSTGKGIVRYA